MKTELGKWNPFKFLRKTTSDKQPMGDASNVPAPRHGTPDWPDVAPPQDRFVAVCRKDDRSEVS
ncbi:hypothetical protein [Cupriavidus basilensis]|uniref:hypothetical protein n=1 Tax=Cupriavidus basilensis TaxID=68895 RepID=UPI00191C30D8|nr:hypothetical protein [Cupriavidus basilensis]